MFTGCLDQMSLFVFYEPIFSISKIPLPHFSKKTQAAIASGDIVLPLPRAAFMRECVAHYEPMLPRPTHEQYTAITKALLEQYPSLRDRGTFYWVSKAWDIFQLSIQVTRGEGICIIDKAAILCIFY